MPPGKTAIVLILADGQEAPIEAQITVLNAALEPTDPNAYWPTTYIQGDTAVVRSVIPTKVGGVPDLQPQPPAANPSYCLLATCVVDNGTIVSCTQETGQQIVPQDQLATIVAGLSGSVAGMQQSITGLLSGVSALALSVTSLRAQEQADISNLQNQINALAARTTAPTGAIFRGADYFVDLSESNPAATGYNAIVSGGLRFATAAHADFAFTAQNPYAGNLQTAGTLLMPKYVIGFHGTLPFNAGDYGYNSLGSNPYGFFSMGTAGTVNVPVLRRGFSRARVRSSVGLKAISAAQALANGDPSQLFAIDPTTFVYDPSWGTWQTSTAEFVRQDGFWNDLASRGYWTPVVGVGSTGGQPVLDQPFTPSSSMMVGQIGLNLNPLTGANIRLLIMGDINGNPDPNHTLVDVSVASPDHTTYTGTVQFAMPYPILLKGGRTYHFMFLTDTGNISLYTGSHVGNGAQASFGDMLTFVNGAWTAPRAGGAISMSIQQAFFDNPNIRIPLAPLQLTGGADTVDIQASVILPEGCSIGYEVYVGGQWVPLQQITNSTNPLAGNPTNLPLNMVISGTLTVAPIIDTAASTCRFSKSSAALDHVSSVQTPSAPVTTIHKSIIVDNWVGNPVQTLTANLRTGTGYATNTPPATPVDAIQADGSLLRTWTWTLGAAVPSFEMEVTGTTTDVTKTFTGRQTNWDASP